MNKQQLMVFMNWVESSIDLKIAESFDRTIIYHASGQLRFRMNEVLKKHLSDDVMRLDPGCFEQGCCVHDDRVDKDGVSAVVLEIK